MTAQLVECIGKTSAAILLVWLATALARRWSASLRHVMWMSGLASFLVIPALLPLARRTPVVRLAIPLRGALEAMPVELATPGPRGNSSPRVMPTTGAVLGCVWLSGALLPGVRRTRAAWRMRGIAGRSVEAPEGIGAGRAVAIRVSPEIRTPLTWGLVRPMILLPPGALEWNAGCLGSVLEHEREHIRRRDPVFHWFAELVCVVWWFHPLAWLARSRAAHERECACDDAVLRSGVRASDYASDLVNLAATLSIQGEPIMALSALSNFERRIRNLLVSGIDRGAANTRSRVGVALAVLAVLAPLAMVRAQAPAGQGDLSGTVFDATGARVPRALVTASGSSGNREITRADAAGEWSFVGIPAGDYKVEVAAPGFALGLGTMTLAAGQKATLPQTLALGKVQQTISVVGQGQARRTVVQSSDTPQRIRVGGMVQATKLLRQIRPAYPASALAQGIEGTVLLGAVIGKDGDLLSVAVMNKLADPDLAAAALDAVKQWHYQPTLLNGEPVEVSTTITVNFSLQP